MLIVLLALARAAAFGGFSVRPAARTSRPAMMAQKYAEFQDLEADIKAYIATLDDTALNDPDAPSPLAYAELGTAGRPDLAEGCMKHGGYLAVSSKLGVRIQRKQPAKEGFKTKVAFGGDNYKTGAEVTLSGNAMEDKMANDLARLASKGKAEVSTGGENIGGASVSRDRLTPFEVTSQSSKSKPVKEAVKDGPMYGLGRYIRLDTLQRSNAILLAVLLAVAFGNTSGQVLDSSTVGAVQLAADALCVGHVMITGYGTFLASQAEGEDPVLWALKLLLTGAGGFAELQGSLAKK